MKHTRDNIRFRVITYLNSQEDLPKEYYYLRADVVRYIWDNISFLDPEVAAFLKYELEMILKQHIANHQIHNGLKPSETQPV